MSAKKPARPITAALLVAVLVTAAALGAAARLSPRGASAPGHNVTHRADPHTATTPASVAVPTPAPAGDPSTLAARPVTTPATDPATPPAVATAESRTSAAVPKSAPSAAAIGSAGRRAAIDPETGRIGPPSAAQRAAFARTVPALDRSDEGLETIVLPDGATLVRLDDRFHEYAVARIDASGQIRTDCVQGSGVAARRESAAPAREER